MQKPSSLSLPLYNTQQFSSSTENNVLNPLSATIENSVESAGVRNRREENTTDERDPAPTTRHQFPIIPNPKQRHDKRKIELLQFLELSVGANNNTSFIFLCYGKNNRCHVFPIEIPNSANDPTLWQRVRQGWYAYRGHWRKFLPFFDVREVSVVEISIAGSELKGKQRSKYKSSFVGSYNLKTESLDAEKRELEHIIASYTGQEYPCPYDSSTGSTNCFAECVSTIDFKYQCPERELHKAKRRLSRINMQRFLKLAFSNSSVSKVNSLFDKGGITYSHGDILSKLEVWHCPDLGELQFLGLLISEGWEADLQHVVFPLTVTAFFLIVIGAKLIYGDWGIAWNVGCFFISLATLLWMWANHSVG